MSEVKTLNPLKPEAEAIITFLQANEEEFTCNAIAKELDQTAKSVNPRLTALVKRGLVEKAGKVTCKAINSKTGVEEDRQYETYQISAVGKNHKAE